MRQTPNVIPFAPHQARRFLEEAAGVQLTGCPETLEIELLVQRAPPRGYCYFVSLIAQTDETYSFRAVWQKHRKPQARAKLLPLSQGVHPHHLPIPDASVWSSLTGCFLRVTEPGGASSIAERLFRSASGFQNLRVENG